MKVVNSLLTNDTLPWDLCCVDLRVFITRHLIFVYSAITKAILAPWNGVDSPFLNQLP